MADKLLEKLEEAENKVSKWNRNTVADGNWLQNHTVGPLENRDITIAEYIDDNLPPIQESVNSLSDRVTNCKQKQDALTFNGSTTNTITGITQDENGQIDVTFDDIDIPQQVPNIEIESSTLDIEPSVDPDTNTKTFTIDVKKGDVNWINAQSALTDIYINASTTITGYTKKDGNIDIVPKYNLLQLKNEVPYLVIEEVTLKTVEPVVDSYSDVQVHLFNEGISGAHAGDIVAHVRLDNSNAYTQTVTVGGILYGGKTGKTSDDYFGGIYASVMNKFTGSVIETNTVNATVNNISVYELTGIMSQGGGESSLTAGNGIYIDGNNQINVLAGNGLEFDDNKLQVKLGNTYHNYPKNQTDNLYKLAVEIIPSPSNTVEGWAHVYATAPFTLMPLYNSDNIDTSNNNTSWDKQGKNVNSGLVNSTGEHVTVPFHWEAASTTNPIKAIGIKGKSPDSGSISIQQIVVNYK